MSGESIEVLKVLCRAVSRARCYRRDMPVPRRYTTDAIVLSRFDLGEADRVLTLITPGIGKLKAIAKGIRRPTSRIGGSLNRSPSSRWRSRAGGPSTWSRRSASAMRG